MISRRRPTSSALALLAAALLPVSNGQVQMEILSATAEEVIPEAGSVNADDTSQENHCQLVALLDFHFEGEPLTNRQHPGESLNASRSNLVAESHLIAAELAVEHFNARNPIVVPELAELNCSVQLPPLIVKDTDDPKSTIAEQLFGAATKPGASICAIVGPFTNEATLEAGVLAKALVVPQIGNGADDTLIANDLAPFVATPYSFLTTVNQHAVGEALVNYLRGKNRTNFLAVIHDTSAYGTQGVLGIDNGAKEALPFTFTHVHHSVVAPPFSGMEPNQGIGYALSEVKKTSYRTIVVVIKTIVGFNALQIFADYADKLEMNGGDYVWVFLTPSEILPSHFVDYQRKEDGEQLNDNLTKLLTGAAVFKPLDAYDKYPEQDDAFGKEWKKTKLLQMMLENEDFSVPVRPQPGSAFMYDAVVLAALGRCKHEQNEMAGVAGPPDDEGAPQQAMEEGSGSTGAAGSKATGPEETATATTEADGTNNRRRRVKGVKSSPKQRRLQDPPKKKKKKAKALPPKVQAITEVEFHGATGKVEYTERWRRNRQRDTMSFAVYNLRPLPDDDTKLWYYLTDILEGFPVTGTWTETLEGPFLFPSGLSSAPELLHDPPVQNYLSLGVMVFGLVLMSVSLLMSLMTGAFICYHHNARIIKRYQPEFLYLLLVGTVIMTSSIFAISFDEGAGWTDEMLDGACIAFPWLLSTGYITIQSAFFMKLWRLHQVLQVQRRAITAAQVTWPFIIMMVCNVTILLVWTVVDPFHWSRSIIDEQSLESYGRCESEHANVFGGLVGSLMALSTILSFVTAWQTKDVDENFSEARWIFYTIALQIQVLIISVPLLLTLDSDSADATYLGRMLVIFSIPICAILLIFGPKVKTLWEQSRDGANAAKRSRSTRGTTGGTRVSGLNLQQPVGNTTLTSSVEDPSYSISASQTSRRGMASPTGSRRWMSTRSDVSKPECSLDISSSGISGPIQGGPQQQEQA